MCSFTPVYHAPPLFLSPSPLLQEELEEGGTAVYDDFKFVTREELDSLRLTELMGTNLLRPFMHGFFIHSRLYHKVRYLMQQSIQWPPARLSTPFSSPARGSPACPVLHLY